MKSNPNFDRDYLAALVQLTRQVTIAVDKRTGQQRKVPIWAINGVPITEQINAARRAL